MLFVHHIASRVCNKFEYCNCLMMPLFSYNNTADLYRDHGQHVTPFVEACGGPDQYDVPVCAALWQPEHRRADDWHA